MASGDCTQVFCFFDKKRKLFGVIVPSELSRYLAILLYNGTRDLLTGNERGWCFFVHLKFPRKY